MEVCVRISCLDRRKEKKAVFNTRRPPSLCKSNAGHPQQQTHQDSRTHILLHTHSRARQQGGPWRVAAVSEEPEANTKTNRRAAARTLQKSVYNSQHTTWYVDGDQCLLVSLSRFNCLVYFLVHALAHLNLRMPPLPRPPCLCPAFALRSLLLPSVPTLTNSYARPD